MTILTRLTGRPSIVALVLGATSALAFQPTGIWPLMPIAIGLLCAILSRARSTRQTMLVGWLFGLGQFVVGLSWLPTSFTYQGNMPSWLGWIALVLLSLYLAIYPALATGCAWRIGRGRPLALVLGLAGSWTLAEWLRATLFTGFAWNPLAAAAVDQARFLVPLIGTYGASAMLVLLGGGIWLVLERNSVPLLVTAGIATLAGLLTGYLLEPGPGSGKAVRVIQPNIGQEDKWRPGFSEQAAQRLASLSMQPGGGQPRLLLWPEAAVTEPLEDARTNEHQAFAQYERTRAAALVRPGEYLLTGGIALESADGLNVSGAANSVFVLGSGGQLLARYDKAHLVPYGEYLPMRPLLSSIGLSRLAPGNVDFSDGPGPRTLALPGWGKVGLQICYEIIFSGQVTDRKHRPDFIFNPSNDAWFGRWGPPQHLAQARLRAAEEGLPVIRSTPTGISAIIDARGRVVKSLPWRTAGVIDGALPPATRVTPPFARYGNLIPLLLALGLMIAAIALSARQRYRAT